jgi:hypothetical protein
MLLAEEHKPAQAFGLDRKDESFGVGVGRCRHMHLVVPISRNVFG